VLNSDSLTRKKSLKRLNNWTRTIRIAHTMLRSENLYHPAILPKVIIVVRAFTIPFHR